MKKIVAIGGGTGSAVVLSGLKDRANIDLSAVIVVSDNGGSTGRLRDEFGFLPVGDLRQCIAALATGENQKEIRQLLLYRFDKDSSLQGHNLGNLILTSLESLTGSAGKAVEVASKIFRINGAVLPISEDSVHLVIHYSDGQIVVGEKNLDDPQFGGKKINKITLDKKAKIYDKAYQAIANADLIVFGPGDLYGSLLPHTLVDGFVQALGENKKKGGKFVYVSNLVTHFSQTYQMSAKDHLEKIKQYCQRSPDFVLMNNSAIPEKILQLYQEANDFPIVDDLKTEENMQIVRDDLISTAIVQAENNDLLQRSLIRHHKQKLAENLLKLI